MIEAAMIWNEPNNKSHWDFENDPGWAVFSQMTTLAGQAHDAKLKTLLEDSVSGITKHSETLKSLIEASGEEAEPEHCKGLEGLVKEALKHCVKEAPEDGELRDIAIIAQYQRMSHYGVTGFGSAAAYATALGRKDDAKQLKGIVSDIYKADEYTSKLGEKLAKLAAKHDQAKEG